MPLNQEELQRYTRHFSLSEVGITGQKKIQQAKVLCVGAGGLGSPVIAYLSAAGVGTLGIIDHDVVDISNLQRQIIHNTFSIGQPKVLSAARWVKENNPHVKVITYQESLNTDNALTIIPQYDAIIDGTDNFASHYLINDACFFAKKPYIYASILQFSGQISVFCSPKGPCYRCLFPSMPPADAVPNCAEGGVFGVLPGLLGVMQATEALKVIVGCGEPLINRLLSVNTLNMEFDLFSFSRNPDCALCGDNPTITTLQMSTPTCKTLLPEHNIDATTLRQQLQENPDLVLIDVREPYELAIIDGIDNAINIPLNTLPDNLNKLPRTTPFVVYCKSGSRSLHATKFLREQGFDCQNLSGGIEKW